MMHETLSYVAHRFEANNLGFGPFIGLVCHVPNELSRIVLLHAKIAHFLNYIQHKLTHFDM